MFDFPNHLDEKAAGIAIKLWKEEAQKIINQGKIDLIFNCLQMRSFETEARKKWQSTLKEQKNELGQIWVVCENVFILGAAKTMGLMSGYSIKVTRSLSEINN